MKKITVLCLVLSMVILFNSLMATAGEDPKKYPSKPLTYIVIWGAGGPADVTGRKLCEMVEPMLGQTLVVENKAGGSGSIGTALIAQAKPDGYTIGSFSQSPTILLPHIRKVPYDTKKGFSFIVNYAEYIHAYAVKPGAPWKTWKDFIEDARKNPGKFTYGSTGPNSHINLYMEQIFAKEKVKVTHVPFKGSRQLTTAVLGGHIDSGLCTSVVVPHLKAGKVVALAVDTRERWSFLPGVPTFEELGHKIDMPTFTGIVGPAGIPQPILKKLRKAFYKASQDPSFVEFLEKIKMAPSFMGARKFKKAVFRAYDKQGKLIKK
jgi:tripartite-type tricarboxylate transporter receptor subunit TctC